MPLHNTKGNARGLNNRIKRASSDLGPIEAFKNAKSGSTMPMSPWLTAQTSRMHAGAISGFK